MSFFAVWIQGLYKEVILTTSIPAEWKGSWKKGVLLTVLEEVLEVLDVSVIDWESTAMGFVHQLLAVGSLEVSGMSSYQEFFWGRVSQEGKGK